MTEHRAHARRCGCGALTAAVFPVEVRAPVSYGPRVRATVAYLLGRQHLPTRRVTETMTDLFGLRISTGAIDAVYSERLPSSPQLRHRPGGAAAQPSRPARR